MPVDLRLYLITDSCLCAGRGVISTVAAAVAGGVTAVQVRDPAATTRALFELSGALLGALAGTGVPLIVNDRLDVALAAGAAGVHLGQADLPPVEARRIAGADVLIGWSVTTVAEAEEATRLPAGTVDYLGVGPVYPTATKTDAAPAIGLAGLRRATHACGLPCVAIGGIGVGNAADVMAAGAAGVAVVSAICSAADPEEEARRLWLQVGG